MPPNTQWRNSVIQKIPVRLPYKPNLQIRNRIMCILFYWPVNTHQSYLTVHATEYSYVHPQHLCLHLCIFVSNLCSLCYWTEVSGSRSDKWYLALVWTAHQMRQKSRNCIWYRPPPCQPTARLSPPTKEKKNWAEVKTQKINNILSAGSLYVLHSYICCSP